jgi:hypothetical protein
MTPNGSVIVGAVLTAAIPAYMNAACCRSAWATLPSGTGNCPRQGEPTLIADDRLSLVSIAMVYRPFFDGF